MQKEAKKLNKPNPRDCRQPEPKYTHMLTKVDLMICSDNGVVVKEYKSDSGIYWVDSDVRFYYGWSHHLTMFYTRSPNSSPASTKKSPENVNFLVHLLDKPVAEFTGIPKEIQELMKKHATGIKGIY